MRHAAGVRWNSIFGFYSNFIFLDRPARVLGMSHALSITVSEFDRCRLEALASDDSASRRHIHRAEAILLIADGMSVRDISRRTGRSKVFILRWQERFIEQGFEGLLHNKRASCRNRAEIVQQGKALMLVGSMVEDSSWNSFRNSALLELTRIEGQLAEVFKRLEVLDSRSVQQLSYYSGVNGGSRSNPRSFDDENSFAAHVAFGLSKYRVTN